MSRDRLAVVGACLLATSLFTVPAFAQEDGGTARSPEAQRRGRRGPDGNARPFEVFGGFSYLDIDAGGDALLFDDVGGFGFQAQFTYFVNEWLGVAAELGKHSADLDGIPVILIFPPPDIDFSQTTVLLGPRFRFARTERFEAAAHVLGGVANAEIDLDLGFPLPENTDEVALLTVFEFDDTVPAFALGMTFDLQLDDRIAWRIVQPDVLVTTYGDDSQTHLRLATGVTISF